jgi:hypothetical protein
VTVTGGRGTKARIVESTHERFVLERTLPAGTGRGQPHVHLDYVQSFEVTGGDGRISVDGDERGVAAGDRVELARGTAHRDPWNPAGSDMSFRMTIAPRPYFVVAYAANWTRWLQEGRLNEQDEFTVLQLFAILKATRAQSFAAGPPIWLQRPMLALLGRLGRLAHRPLLPLAPH